MSYKGKRRGKVIYVYWIFNILIMVFLKAWIESLQNVCKAPLVMTLLFGVWGELRKQTYFIRSWKSSYFCAVLHWWPQENIVLFPIIQYLYLVSKEVFSHEIAFKFLFVCFGSNLVLFHDGIISMSANFNYSKQLIFFIVLLNCNLYKINK